MNPRHLLTALFALLLLCGATAPAATNAPAPVAVPFERLPLPLDLTSQYHTNFFHPNYKGPGLSLARGVQKVDGVPFQVIGQAGLWGKRLAERNTIYRESLRDIPVRRTFDELHLIHHAFWNSEDGTTLARLRIYYDDDSSEEIPIRYGEHVRDWFRLKYEERQTPTDPGTKIFFDGQSEAAARLSGSMRMFRTVLTNPHPAKLVRTLDFTTARAHASYSLIAATVCYADTNRVPDKPIKLKNPERTFDGAARVRVVDAESGHPVPGAVLDVTVSDDTGGYPLLPYITGASGEKTIRYPTEPIRSISFSVEAPGYAGRRIQWKTPFPAETLLKLEPALIIGGTVVNQDNQPVRGARVSARSESSSTSGSVTSDSSGRWTVSNIKKGATSFSVSVSHSDYPPASFRTDPTGQSGESNAIPLKDFLGQTAVLKLSKGVSLLGAVYRHDGTPATNATVAFNRHGGNYAEKTVKSDDTGKFEFKGLAEGEFVLMINAGGSAPWWKRVQLTATSEPLNITLEKGGVLKGRVVDKGGNPIEGAKVTSANNYDSAPVKLNLTTDAEGRFHFGAAPVEGMQVVIQKEEFAYKSLHMNPSDTEMEISLRKAGIVKGTVIDADTRAAITNFTVITAETYGSDHKDWDDSKSFTDSEGKFSMSLKSTEQRYIVQVEAEGYFPSISPPFANEEEDMVIEFELRKGDGPSGVVLRPDGQPAAGASVKVMTKAGHTSIRNASIDVYDSHASITTTDAEGRFKLKAQPDATGLVAVHEEGFAIITGMPYPNMTVQLKGWGRIEGIVLSGGRPKPGERLTIGAPKEASGGNMFFNDHSATTDAEGRFAFEKVPPGEVSVIRLIPISKNSWTHSHGTSVTVQSGQTAQVVLGNSGRQVTGRIILPEAPGGLDFSQSSVEVGTPFPQSPTTLRTPEEADAWNNSAVMQEYRGKHRRFAGTVSADGTFNLEDIPPGEYDLRVTIHDPESPAQFGQQINEFANPQRITVPDAGSGAPHDVGGITVKLRPRPGPR